MSRSPYATYPPHHAHHGRPYIVVHGHDILCGRGVNIASHSGNERFRSLVQLRLDENYCTAYTTTEKRAVAEQILGHIRSLDPPGRFLRRIGRAPTSRGLQGPWEELSDREIIKKTCQALRDCSRQDRSGYAAAVAAPDDVRQHAEYRSASGMSNKEQAAAAAAAKARAEGTMPAPPARSASVPPTPHAGSMGVAMAPGSAPISYHHALPPGAVPMHMQIPMGMPMPHRPGLNPASHGHAYAAAPMPLPLSHQMQQHHPVHSPRQMHHPHHPPQHQSQLVSFAHDPLDRRTSLSHGHAVAVSQAYSPHLGHTGQPLPPPAARLPEANHYSPAHAHEHHYDRHNGVSYDDHDRNVSPSVENAAIWLKKQKTVDTRIQRAEGTIPSNLGGGAHAYLSEGMLTSYTIPDSARTPSQETSTTTGTTPTTIASSAHRPSLSPASAAMHPSPPMAYHPHHVDGGNPVMYSHRDDFNTSPTPTTADPFAFHHHEHPIVSSNPSSELKSSTFDGAPVHLDQQQLQAAAEAAAAAFAASDGHNDDYATGSTDHYNHDDSLPLL